MKTNSEQLPVNKTFKLLMLLLALIAIFLLSSCSSGWSCQKRYVDVDKSTKTEKNVQTQNKNV